MGQHHCTHLGAIIVPLAFLLEVLASPPLWVQAVLWGVIMLLATAKSLRPLKPDDWLAIRTMIRMKFLERRKQVRISSGLVDDGLFCYRSGFISCSR